MAHLLLEKAFRFHETPKPKFDSRYYYDYVKGAWMVKNNDRDIFLVKSIEKPDPLTTKKADIETGEDQKGY